MGVSAIQSIEDLIEQKDRGRENLLSAQLLELGTGLLLLMYLNLYHQCSWPSGLQI